MSEPKEKLDVMPDVQQLSWWKDAKILELSAMVRSLTEELKVWKQRAEAAEAQNQN